MIGAPLQFLARLAGRDVDDFQDLRAWRVLTALAIRCARAVTSVVIVPMAFSDLRYLGEIRAGLQRTDQQVYHFCLVAPLEVVEQRLRDRGAHPTTHAWEFRRAAECCAAHKHPLFAKHVAAADSPPDDLAKQIAKSVRELAGHAAERGVEGDGAQKQFG